MCFEWSRGLCDPIDGTIISSIFKITTKPLDWDECEDRNAIHLHSMVLFFVRINCEININIMVSKRRYGPHLRDSDSSETSTDRNNN